MKLSPGLGCTEPSEWQWLCFTAVVTHGVSKGLGIEYHLHCSWRPQPSGKVEKANDIIKRYLHKLTEETQDNWVKVLPRSLMRVRTTPQKEGLPPFECIYGRPFLCKDIFRDHKALELTSYVTRLSAFQKAIIELWEMTPDPSKPLFEPGTEVLIKSCGLGAHPLSPSG